MLYKSKKPPISRRCSLSPFLLCWGWCMLCALKNYIYIYVYTYTHMYLKTLKRHSWLQTVQWVSTQWICMKESVVTNEWDRHWIFVSMFFNKGSWHGVFKLLGFSNQPSQPELNRSDTSITPKWLVPSGTRLREYWHSSWFLKLLIKLNLYIYFVNLCWLTFKDFGSIDF